MIDNPWTCNSDEYNYCFDHKLCENYHGYVRCECDLSISKDISPQVKLYPGEKCQLYCSNNERCLNGGVCLIRDNGMESCYCLDRFIGDYCQIDLLSISLIFFI